MLQPGSDTKPRRTVLAAYFRTADFVSEPNAYRARNRKTLWGERRGSGNFVAASTDGVPRCPSQTTPAAPGQALSRSLVALDQNSTIIAVVELSQSSWLVAGMLPGIERQPRKFSRDTEQP